MFISRENSIKIYILFLKCMENFEIILESREIFL
jgi:hypothetical protein